MDRTADLLDRATLYRAGMELRRRGVTAEEQAGHAAQYLGVLRDAGGLPLYRDYC